MKSAGILFLREKRMNNPVLVVEPGEEKQPLWKVLPYVFIAVMFLMH
jgi:hypothetical protein